MQLGPSLIYYAWCKIYIYEPISIVVFSSYKLCLHLTSPPMAITPVLLSFLFALALVEASQDLHTSQLLKGSVNCLDCPRGSDLSGPLFSSSIDLFLASIIIWFAIIYTFEGNLYIIFGWKESLYISMIICMSLCI